MNKWRIQGTNALKRLRLKILGTLRRIIFGSEDEVVAVKQDEDADEPDMVHTDRKEKRKKNIEMNLKFNEVEEERRADLQDIQIYLNANEKKKQNGKS